MALLTRNTWVKIALVALLCVVFCGSLLSCSMGCSAAVSGIAGGPNLVGVDYRQLPNVGSGSMPAQDVRDLEIDWMAGEVVVEVVPDEEADGAIVLEESASGRIPDNLRMRWGLEGQRLVVATGPSQGLWGCSMANSGTALTVRIPASTARSLGTVELNAASGRYELDGIGCERLAVSLASGRIDGAELAARTLEVSLASGDAQLRGSFPDQLSIDAASGDVTVACESVTPARTDIDIASGDVLVELPEDAGFTARVDRVSGSFDCDLPGTMRDSDDQYVRGDGSSRIGVSMASGHVVLRALQALDSK